MKIYDNLVLEQNVYVGQLLYALSDTKFDNWENHFKEEKSSPLKDNDGILVTNKAKVLMQQHGLNSMVFNMKVIREVDVINYINSNLNKSTAIIDKNLLPKNLTNCKKTPLIVIGAKGGAKMCVDALKESKEYFVAGLLDDNINIGNCLYKYPIVGKLLAYKELIELGFTNFVLAFGIIENRGKRFKLFKKMKGDGATFPNIIHPKSIVESSVSLGEGNVLLAGANIGSSVKIGHLNYLNTSCIVSHDCVIKDNVHISPGAVLASSILVNSHVLIGMNATLYIGLNIGENSTILNGLIINKDLEPNKIQRNSN